MTQRASLTISLTALRAFEAVVRLGGLAPAARELGLTPSALSHQLQAVARGFAVPLMERQGRQLRATPAGLALARQLAEPFAAIDRAVAERRSSRAVLTISVHDSLAAHWLLPRMARFSALWPDVDVRLSATARLVDLDRELVDCAIRLGPGGWPGVTAQALVPQHVAPAVRSDRAAADSWPRIVQQGQADEWQRWPGVGGAGQMSVPNRDLTISAVLAGSGVGIVDLIVTADHLVSGAITPIGSAATTGWQYHLVLPQRRRPGAAVRQFQDWLVAEMADTQQQLAARGVA